MIITKVIDTVFCVSDQLKIEFATHIVQDNTNSGMGNKCVPNISLYKDRNETLQEITSQIYRKIVYKMRLVGPNAFNKTYGLRSRGLEIDGGDLYRIARFGEKILDRIYDENDDFAISRRDKALYDSLHNGENVYTDINGSYNPNDRLLFSKKSDVYGPRLELSNFAVITSGFRLYPMDRRFPTPISKNVVGIEMRLSPEVAQDCVQLGFDPFPILTEFEMSELVDFCKKFDPVSYAASVCNNMCVSTLNWMSNNEFKDRTRQNSSYDDVVNQSLCTATQAIAPKQMNRPDAKLRQEMSMLMR